MNPTARTRAVRRSGHDRTPALLAGNAGPRRYDVIANSHALRVSMKACNAILTRCTHRGGPRGAI